MEGKQLLYYALGQLAYSVAKADGIIQPEEKDMLHKIVVDEAKNHDIDFNIADIIFHILQNDQKDLETTYNWAIQSMKTGKHYFTTDMKKNFVAVLHKVADSFPPETPDEQSIITRFEQDLAAM